MEHVELLKDIKFSDEHPIAQSIHADKNGRLLHFALEPGQEIKEHSSPTSPVYIVVLKGEGTFYSGDGSNIKAKLGSIIMYEVGEKHSIKAGEEQLVFVAILHGAPRKEN
ncbi:MAG: cupin domain-containing protein [Thermodesulfobacteriota bacterium]